MLQRPVTVVLVAGICQCGYHEIRSYGEYGSEMHVALYSYECFAAVKGVLADLGMQVLRGKDGKLMQYRHGFYTCMCIHWERGV